jgi:hypothetical protein
MDSLQNKKRKRKLILVPSTPLEIKLFLSFLNQFQLFQVLHLQEKLSPSKTFISISHYYSRIFKSIAPTRIDERTTREEQTK